MTKQIKVCDATGTTLRPGEGVEFTYSNPSERVPRVDASGNNDADYVPVSKTLDYSDKFARELAERYLKSLLRSRPNWTLDSFTKAVMDGVTL